MTRMTQKVLSLLVALSLVAGLVGVLFPLQVHAAEGDLTLTIGSPSLEYSGNPEVPQLAVDCEDSSGYPVRIGNYKISDYYDVTYSHSIDGPGEHTNVGTVTVTVTGKGIYVGKSDSKTFEIIKHRIYIYPDNGQTKVINTPDPILTCEPSPRILPPGCMLVGALSYEGTGVGWHPYTLGTLALSGPGSSNYELYLISNANLNYTHLFAITANGSTDTYTLDVEKGYYVSSGGFHVLMEGMAVEITAYTPSFFTRWESDAGGTFENSTSSTTTFTMPAHDVTVTAIYSDSTNGTTYNVTTKPSAPYTGTGNAKFTIDADFSKFEKLTLNGAEIASSNFYTAQSGSTIITLLDSYLKTLSNGTHIFRAVFDDGYANLTLVIANPTSPAPGQQSGSGSGGVGNGNSGSVAGSGFGGTSSNHSASVNEDRNPNTGMAPDVIVIDVCLSLAFWVGIVVWRKRRLKG